MKINWVVTFGVTLLSILYACIVLLFNLNPINEVINLITGANFKFFTLVSPFIYITLICYAIILPKELSQNSESKKNKINSKKSKNVIVFDETNSNIEKSVLGRIQSLSPKNENDLKSVIQNNKIEISNRQPIEKISEPEGRNDLETRAQKLESYLLQSKNNNNNRSEIQRDVPANIEKKDPKIITLLREEEPLQHNMLSILKDINPRHELEQNDQTEIEPYIDRFALVSKELEDQERNKFEVISFDDDDAVSDLEAKHIAEGLEDGNTLFTDKEILNRRKETFNILDGLNEAMGLDLIFKSKSPD